MHFIGVELEVFVIRGLTRHGLRDVDKPRRAHVVGITAENVQVSATLPPIDDMARTTAAGVALDREANDGGL